MTLQGLAQNIRGEHPLQCLGITRLPVFDRREAFMEDLPGQPAQAISDGPYRLVVAETRQESQVT